MPPRSPHGYVDINGRAWDIPTVHDDGGERQLPAEADFRAGPGSVAANEQNWLFSVSLLQADDPQTVTCNPASGWDVPLRRHGFEPSGAGQVEKNVQDARRRLWQPMASFPGIDALNVWLEAQCIAQWGKIEHGALPGDNSNPPDYARAGRYQSMP